MQRLTLQLLTCHQWPRDASAADFLARQDVRTHRDEGIPTAEARLGGDSAYRENVGIGRRRRGVDHGMCSTAYSVSDESGQRLSRRVKRQVGDSIDDMTAGYKARAATVLLANEGNGELKEHVHTERWIERLDELVGILEEGF